jgi:hypothetical protein
MDRAKAWAWGTTGCGARFHDAGERTGKMSNPIRAWNEWCALSLQTARLGWEAQGVIAIRLMRLAAQGSGSKTEARRMITEKAAALAEAQAATVAAIVTGGESRRVAKKVLGVYQKRVRANKRRLTRK